VPQVAVALNSTLADDLLIANIGFAASGDNTVIPAASDQIRIFKLLLVSDDGQANLIFKSGSTLLCSPFKLGAGVPLVLGFDSRSWITTAPGQPFVINSDSTTTSIGGCCWFTVGE
jgi:hypothetical protein